MNEVITLHGGPKHGITMAVPFDQGNTLSVESLVKAEGKLATRKGQYTRVTSHGKLTHDFEWTGYTGPAQKMEIL
jgi:hypothetical protein